MIVTLSPLQSFLKRAAKSLSKGNQISILPLLKTPTASQLIYYRNGKKLTIAYKLIPDFDNFPYHALPCSLYFSHKLSSLTSVFALDVPSAYNILLWEICTHNLLPHFLQVYMQMPPLIFFPLTLLTFALLYLLIFIYMCS